MLGINLTVRMPLPPLQGGLDLVGAGVMGVQALPLIVVLRVAIEFDSAGAGVLPPGADPRKARWFRDV